MHVAVHVQADRRFVVVAAGVVVDTDAMRQHWALGLWKHVADESAYHLRIAVDCNLSNQEHQVAVVQRCCSTQREEVVDADGVVVVAAYATAAFLRHGRSSLGLDEFVVVVRETHIRGAPAAHAVAGKQAVD